MSLCKNSDIVCFATPVYLWNMTACLKNFSDRLIPTKCPRVVETNGDFDMQTSITKMPEVVIISNAGFPGDNNFHTMKEVMKTTNPILEIYRNCGMLLRMKHEQTRPRIDEYLSFVGQAGFQIASGEPVSDATKNGLAMELLPVEEYIKIIGKA